MLLKLDVQPCYSLLCPFKPLWQTGLPAKPGLSAAEKKLSCLSIVVTLIAELVRQVVLDFFRDRPREHCQCVDRKSASESRDCRRERTKTRSKRWVFTIWACAKRWSQQHCPRVQAGPVCPQVKCTAQYETNFELYTCKRQWREIQLLKAPLFCYKIKNKNKIKTRSTKICLFQSLL